MLFVRGSGALALPQPKDAKRRLLVLFAPMGYVVILGLGTATAIMPTAKLLKL